MYSYNEIMYFVFYFSFLIFIFVIWFSTLLNNEILWTFLSIYGVYNKQNVGAGINALMSNSDGLGPSIFCRKMEKARPMMEEMVGKVVFFPARVGNFNFEVMMLKVFFPICILTWRVNNYVSRQEKV